MVNTTICILVILDPSLPILSNLYVLSIPPIASTQHKQYSFSFLNLNIIIVLILAHFIDTPRAASRNATIHVNKVYSRCASRYHHNIVCLAFVYWEYQLALSVKRDTVQCTLHTQHTKLKKKKNVNCFFVIWNYLNFSFYSFCVQGHANAWVIYIFVHCVYCNNM